HRRGEPPAIQIRPSNEVLKTPVRQGLTGKLGSTNRTLVNRDIGFFARVRVLDALLASLRSCLDQFPDKRRGLNTTYRLPDIGMAAFSVFFMQSPSLLAQHPLLAMLDPAPRQGRYRILPRHAGGDVGRTRARQGHPAGAGIHRA